MLAISVVGVFEIADDTEDPLGLDPDDILLRQVVDRLDEGICLIVNYSGLDGFGGENPYRSMMNQEVFMLGED